MLNETRHWISLLLTAVVFCSMIGCAKTGVGDSIRPSEHSATVTRYHLRGVVLGKSDQTNELSVRHEAISGFMPAMTTAYRVKDPMVIHKVQPGNLITADVLVASDSSDYFLDNVAITSGTKGRLIHSVLPPHQLLPGETIPNISLLNQDGRTIGLGDFRGKALLITFIYTRCPMPTACPRISSHLARVNETLSKNPEAYSRSHLISVSLDPSYDTPAIMRDYGLAYLNGKTEGFSHWEFVSTTAPDLTQLAGALGLVYTVKAGQIAHTMQTVLVGPDGKFIQAWPGSDWTEDDVAAAVSRSTMVRH